MDPTLPRFEGGIILAQTAAGAEYEAMLAATAERHRQYCEANAIRLWQHVGVHRGTQSWHATFNRIEMLRELLSSDWHGWFLYLDADAVIRQMSFDIRRYLGRRQKFALVAASGGSEDWMVNAGVFFLNLDDARARLIAARWIQNVDMVITDQLLEHSVSPWQPLANGDPFPDDQHLLQIILRDEPELLASTLVDRDRTFNMTGSRFIRQYLRASGTPAERLAAIGRTIAETA